MPKKNKKRKRKPLTQKQLKALERGRAIRRKQLHKHYKRKNPNPKRYKRPLMKRRKLTNDLTGGTGDVNPQYYSGEVRMAVANTTLTFGFITPHSKLPRQGNKVTVMEVLKLYLWFPTEAINNAAETHQRAGITMSTKDFAAVYATSSEPTVIAKLMWTGWSAFTALYPNTNMLTLPLVMDLTDGDGHGVLVASDYFYMQGFTLGYAAIMNLEFKILYRFKNVSLTEYIGIVQSQQ